MPPWPRINILLLRFSLECGMWIKVIWLLYWTWCLAELRDKSGHAWGICGMRENSRNAGQSRNMRDRWQPYLLKFVYHLCNLNKMMFSFQRSRSRISRGEHIFAVVKFCVDIRWGYILFSYLLRTNCLRAQNLLRGIQLTEWRIWVWSRAHGDEFAGKLSVIPLYQYKLMLKFIPDIKCIICINASVHLMHPFIIWISCTYVLHTLLASHVSMHHVRPWIPFISCSTCIACIPSVQTSHPFMHHFDFQ